MVGPAVVGDDILFRNRFTTGGLDVIDEFKGISLRNRLQCRCSHGVQNSNEDKGGQSHIFLPDRGNPERAVTLPYWRADWPLHAALSTTPPLFAVGRLPPQPGRTRSGDRSRPNSVSGVRRLSVVETLRNNTHIQFAVLAATFSGRVWHGVPAFTLGLAAAAPPGHSPTHGCSSLVNVDLCKRSRVF